MAAGRFHRSAIAAAPRLERRAMTTLVTGATGFVGSHVTRQLVARGDAGSQHAEPANQQIDARPRRAGAVERLHQVRIGQRVELDEDVSVGAERRFPEIGTTTLKTRWGCCGQR